MVRSQAASPIALANGKGRQMPNDESCRNSSIGSEDLSPDQHLLAAVEGNDIDRAQAALAAGASANAAVELSEKVYGTYSTTPALFIACENGNEEMVSLLLAHGANPNNPMYRQGRLCFALM